MPEPRAGLLLRLPPDLKLALERCARKNLRSVNRQAEAILREHLARNGFLDGTGPATTKDDEE